MWAVRCHHEASLHKQKCFLTLTYNEEHLPENGSIEKRIMQLFIKRLRKKYGNGIRYLLCGEYGSKLMRPHYHVLLFGHNFKDQILWQVQNGQEHYRSAELEELWKNPETNKSYGFSTVGALTFESAAYVARYITKKITGVLSEKHYEHINIHTGEVTNRLPEFITMSRRPGIGKKYYDLHKEDFFNPETDGVLMKSGNKILKVKTPRYYEKMYDIEEPEKLKLIHQRRAEHAEKHKADYTPERLETRRQIQLGKNKQLKRKYEK